MSIIDLFESFAADFELAVVDDEWSRLEKYFAEDATYLNVGSGEPKCIGREAILAYLKADVESVDQRFDSRMLVALSEPSVAGDRLSRDWSCTYTLSGCEELVVEGEARYLFEAGLIKEMEEEPTAESMQKVEAWMNKYGDRLRLQ